MTKVFDGETWYPLPLWCIKFSIPQFLWSFEGVPTNIFLHCDTNVFRGKNVIPPIMHKFFRYPNFSETLKWCLRLFSAVWDQKCSTEKRDTPFSSIKFFESRIFSKTVVFPMKLFSTVRQHIFYRHLRYSPLMHRVFRYPKVSETQTGSSTKFFGTMRRKCFVKKSCHPPA